MSSKDLLEATDTELHEKLHDLYDNLLKLRMKLAAGNLSKNHLLKKTKKEIAVIKTLLSQRKASKHVGV